MNPQFFWRQEVIKGKRTIPSIFLSLFGFVNNNLNNGIFPSFAAQCNSDIESKCLIRLKSNIPRAEINCPDC